MTDTIMNSKATVPSAEAVKKPLVQPATVKPDATTPEGLTFNRAKYSQFKLVRLKLLKSGIIQYDPSYPDLILKEVEGGMILPLTPFFAARLSKTIELIETIKE